MIVIIDYEFLFQPHERTFRISIVEGADYGSVSIGNGVSGILFRTIGYFGVFGCSSGCCLVALLYCAIFMKESLILPSSTANKKEIVTREHVYQVKDVEDKSVETPAEDKGFGKIVRTSVLYIVEGIRTVITPREGWRRALVLLGVFQVRPQYTCTGHKPVIGSRSGVAISVRLSVTSALKSRLWTQTK